MSGIIRLSFCEGKHTLAQAVTRPSLGGLTESTRRAALARLEGRKRGLASLLPFAGPAFVASVAYVDPGNFPLWVRRCVTMLPSLAVIWLGIDVTHALVFSQVLLSLVLPVPMGMLLFFTASGKHMGQLVNRHVTSALAATVAAAILAVNVLLIYQTLSG